MTDPYLSLQTSSLVTSLSSENVVTLALTVACVTILISVFLAGVWRMELTDLLRSRHAKITTNAHDTDTVDICHQSKLHSKRSDFKLHGLPKGADVPNETDYPTKYGIHRQQIDDVEDDDESLVTIRAEADAYRRAYYNAMWVPLLEVGICILILVYLIAAVTRILREVVQLAFGLSIAFDVVIYYLLHCCTVVLVVPATKYTHACFTFLLRVFLAFASWICRI